MRRMLAIMKKQEILKISLILTILCLLVIIWRKKNSVTKFGLAGSEVLSNLPTLGALLSTVVDL